MLIHNPESARKQARLDVRAFEHARIDLDLSVRDVARRMAWHPGSLSNLLTRARQGQAVPLAAICLVGFALGRDPATLIIEAEAEASAESKGNGS